MAPPVVPFGKAVVDTDAHPSLGAIVSRPPASPTAGSASRTHDMEMRSVEHDILKSP